MRYRIFENGAEINIIEADEDFCEVYCGENGYTYERVEEPQAEPETPSDLEARVAALEAENAALTAAIERGMRL